MKKIAIIGHGASSALLTAIEHLRSSNPDLIVIDTTKKIKEEIEKAKAVRQKVEISSLPILESYVYESVDFDNKPFYHNLPKKSKKKKRK